MDMDDELRRAGDALDEASRRHRPSGVAPRGRTPWLAVSAGVLVVAAVVGALYVGRGGDDAASTTPGTGSVSDTTSDTTAVITTPETTTHATDPSTTGAPVLDTGYRCLQSAPVDVGGLTFTIERFPTCSATALVMLRVGGTTSVTCTGPLDAHLSDGTTLTYRTSSTFWDTLGEWAPSTGDAPTTTGEDSPSTSVPYFADPGSARPIVLPADASGDLVFTVSVECPDSTPIGTVDIPFTLAPSSRVGIHFLRVDERAEYYGACGNETAVFSGETWYPLLQAEVALIDPALYPQPAPSSSGLRAPQVMEPGPGDAVGTFVVYGDGVGRYESDSGRVIWLTQIPHTYHWEC